AIDQRIEGNNIAHLNWGTSDAKGVTLSFHVKCSVANLVLGGALSNGNFDMTYPFTYTTNSTPNTWTKYTIYIPGPTSGTWPINNGLGIRVIFNLGSASARLATANVWANSVARGPTGAGSLTTVVNSTFFLTGVQLEVGSVATDFEHRSFGQELDLCKRYFQTVAKGREAVGASFEYMGHGHGWGVSQAEILLRWDKEMRTYPTLESASGTDYFSMSISGGSIEFDNWYAYGFSRRSGLLYKNLVSGFTNGSSYRAQINNASAYVYLNAEL
ncbi:MAG: hypothetical protein VXY28_07065, partial [Bacteroidota bacterium]|nr:hypothetical protein [Bacteroidota bacterium]